MRHETSPQPVMACRLSAMSYGNCPSSACHRVQDAYLTASQIRCDSPSCIRFPLPSWHADCRRCRMANVRRRHAIVYTMLTSLHLRYAVICHLASDSPCRHGMPTVGDVVSQLSVVGMPSCIRCLLDCISDTLRFAIVHTIPPAVLACRLSAMSCGNCPSSACHRVQDAYLTASQIRCDSPSGIRFPLPSWHADYRRCRMAIVRRRHAIVYEMLT